MTNFPRGCRLLWLAVTTGWLIAATTALAGKASELRYAAIVPNYGRPLPLSILSAAERLCRLVVQGRPFHDRQRDRGLGLSKGRPAASSRKRILVIAITSRAQNS